MNHFLIFITAFNAVAPVVALILLGCFLRQKGILSPRFLKEGNWLVFHLCLPALMFINVYDIDGFSSINWSIVLYCAAMITLFFILGLFTAIAVTKEPRRRGVIWQCTFRSNFAIIGVSMASALGGSDAVAASAVICSFAIPLFNIFGVIALSTFSHPASGESSLSGILRKLSSNPMLIGISLGLICLGIRELQGFLFGDVVFSMRRHMTFLYTILTYLKTLTTPLALIVLGGQFEFTAVKALWKEILTGTFWRTILAPLLGIGCAIWLQHIGLIRCGPSEFPALIALFGSPVAVSSAIMAGSMGSDEQLATQLVVWTSIISVATIFLQVYLLLSTGYLSL